MDDLDQLAEILTELGETLRRLTLHLNMFAVEMSSLLSDARVSRLPRSVVPFARQELSDN